MIRAALASTLSGLWGISSGFELCEAESMPGKEEFLNSEKYEIRAWDWQRPGNIIEEITVLNHLRKAYPALQTHLGTRFHFATNEQVLFYSKTAPETMARASVAGDLLGPDDELILVMVTLDPHSIQDTNFELPLYLFGLPDDGSIEVEDLVRKIRFTWYGKWHQLTLNPHEVPYGIWRISPRGFGSGT
jgi:starch synthase (maltosyl-transferring)